MYTSIMSASFESEKNKKAFVYTTMICVAILLLAILISWRLPQTPPPLLQELIEINLGNNNEGFGQVQPLIKGEKGLTSEPADQPRTATVKNQVTEDRKEDDNTDKESAPVTKPEKKTVKVVTPAPPVVAPTPKPQKPKNTYPGGTNASKGNGATEDNGYKYQGNNPNGKADAGNPNGKPDSYGNNPGGKVGGPRVTSGNRKIIRYYSFTGDLEKATIYATIRVSPEGKGTFVGFGKNSTSRNSSYATAITEYLRNILFDRSNEESIVTVQFNFTVN